MSMPGLLRFGDLALGAAIRAGENTAEVVDRLRAADPLDRLRSAATPGQAVQRRVDELRDRLGALTRHGTAERRRGQDRVGRAVDAAMTTIAASPLVNRVVEVQVDRVLRMLADEPERVRALVREQRDTVVGEMVGRVRGGAAAGDAAVERLTLRMTRRDGASGAT
ncbi:hypothetical protein [Actinoplanes sp. DH11]|uniref:hypothetical protein n=1 Tax=Actinoplanes sp. DH11 TaxID=2857011 RepID=UPI0027153F04|nr:hypothetical protein [Actinoplanes sp. DH11]